MNTPIIPSEEKTVTILDYQSIFVDFYVYIQILTDSFYTCFIKLFI